MKHPVYLMEQGSKVSRCGQRLVITKDGSELSRIAALQVSQLILGEYRESPAGDYD